MELYVLSTLETKAPYTELTDQSRAFVELDIVAVAALPEHDAAVVAVAALPEQEAAVVAVAALKAVSADVAFTAVSATLAMPLDATSLITLPIMT